MSIVNKARDFAKKAHEGQVRKYTGEPYFNHCENVAKIFEEEAVELKYLFDAKNDYLDNHIAAAYLHDTVEDTDVTHQGILNEFGYDVANIVFWLTDISKPEDGNRATRKMIDRWHTASAPIGATIVKLADIKDNTKSIVEHDKGFAKVYLKEIAWLLRDIAGNNGDLLRYDFYHEVLQSVQTSLLEIKETEWQELKT